MCEESENGYLDCLHARVFRLIYHVSTNFNMCGRCRIVCNFYYRLCLRGSVVGQVIEENIDK